MGSRTAWSCGCLGCGGLWLVNVIILVLVGRPLSGSTTLTDVGVVPLFGLLAAAIPMTIGVILRLREWAEQAPQRSQQFIDGVHTAMIERDGVAVEEIAEKLGCRVQHVRAALRELVGSRQLMGYREAGTERYHAVDPAAMRSGACPYCAEQLEEPGRRGRCPHRGCEIYPPRQE